MLFRYFFKELDEVDSWTLYVDEPTRKVRYKYEPGCNLVSTMCECIIDTPLVNTLALFVETDLLKDWFPNCTENKLLKEVS